MPKGDRKLTMEELNRPAPEEHREGRKQPLVVLLDDVRSRHNVGSIFRTADAFGAEKLILCGITPVPPHREIEKTALGATASVPWEHAVDIRKAVIDLKRNGYAVWAIEQTANAIRLEDLDPIPERVAVVLGNELNGVSDQVIELSDGCLMLPQAGSKHSLNVSVCAGIILWKLSTSIIPAR